MNVKILRQFDHSPLALDRGNNETIGRNLRAKSGGVDGPVGSGLPASRIENETERRQDVRVFIPSIRRVAG